MNIFDSKKNIPQMQAKVDVFVPDKPLADLIYPSSMTDGLYNPRDRADYGVDQTTGEIVNLTDNTQKESQ